jgi:hypothetical protein
MSSSSFSNGSSNGSTSSNNGFISTLSDEEILKDMDQDDFMIFQMCWQWLEIFTLHEMKGWGNMWTQLLVFKMY